MTVWELLDTSVFADQIWWKGQVEVYRDQVVVEVKLINLRKDGKCWTVGDFCGRLTSCKFEEGTTLQLLVLESAMMGPIYHLLVGICMC